MTPYIEEAQRLLRHAERDYQTFAILRDHPRRDLTSPANRQAPRPAERGARR